VVALDTLNFVVADVVGGAGPFLGVYLRVLHWQAGSIGIALATANAASILTQMLMGALVDAARRKRLIIIIASIAVTIACLMAFLHPFFWWVIASQLIIGVSDAAFGPTIAGMSLGLVGRRRFDRRAGRNQALNHSGNVATAVAAGLVSKLYGIGNVLLLIAALGIASFLAVLGIKADEIDYEAARGGEKLSVHNVREPETLKMFFEDRRILTFAWIAFLFHLSNASMMPQLGQKIAQEGLINPGLYTAVLITLAQLCMVPAALFTSRYSHKWGRKPVLLIAYATLPIRGTLFALVADPHLDAALQILDGVGAGIYDVSALLVAADLAAGTGRFNLTVGLFATSLGVGAALSNLLSGFIVQSAGYQACFFTLASIGLLGCAALILFMPETNPRNRP
jgi:MFS family permease